MIFAHRPDGSIDDGEYEHMMFRISLKGDRQYAICLADAQFRQDRAVMPLDEYKQGFVDEFQGEEDLGYYGIRFNKIA